KKSTNASGSDYFGFIRMTKMAGIIVECGFIDNPTDRKLFDTDAELKKMGVAIAKGVVDTLEEMGYKNGSAAKSEPKRGYTGTFPTLPKRGYFANVDSGTQVKNLQRLLNWAADTKLSVDGSVGPKTIEAVKTFQKKYGLAQDGLFGKSCLAKAKTIKK
ncbi:MAG: peptidoglycan-binding protein, partial [Elusimicrobiaceae bacterium]|nr:peptidoglycan-binding protein [Elusimicrobiaceae bacterium]